MTKQALITFFMSMVPIIELRGAIPYGIATGMPPLEAALLAVLGNMIPVPFIVLFIRQVFKFLRRWKWFRPKIDYLERRANQKSAIVKKFRLVGLAILVAIPLPGTGAWTGALAAAILNIRLNRSIPAIFLGVCVAAVLVTMLTLGVIHVF